MRDSPTKDGSKTRVSNNILLHSDGLETYARVHKDKGQMRDSINHGHRNGGPEYMALRSHTLPSGEVLHALGGTLCMDGWWRWGKQECHGVPRTNPEAINRHVRIAQWKRWTAGKDRWAEAGKVLQFTFKM